MRSFGFAAYDEVASRHERQDERGSRGDGARVARPSGHIRRDQRRNYATNRDGMRGLAGVTLIEYDPVHSPNFHDMVLEIDPARTGLTRDQLHRVLWAENVHALRYFSPGCHRMEPYASRKAGDYPGSEHLASTLLCLPTGSAITLEDVAAICGLIRFALANECDLSARLAATSSADSVASL